MAILRNSKRQSNQTLTAKMRLERCKGFREFFLVCVVGTPTLEMRKGRGGRVWYDHGWYRYLLSTKVHISRYSCPLIPLRFYCLFTF
jgi:hypothetical protein